MVVTTPKKNLPKGQGTDNARDYLKGAIAGGGLWTALETLDNAILDSLVTTKGDLLVGASPGVVNRHPVGANNTVLVADSAQARGVAWSSTLTLTGLDLQGDLTIRDTLSFGAKPAGAGDASISRLSANVLRHNAVAVIGPGALTAPTWRNDLAVAQFNNYAAAIADSGGSLYILSNMYYDGSGSKAIKTGASSQLMVGQTDLFYRQAASASAGAAATTFDRLQINNNGSMTLIPAQDQTALAIRGKRSGIMMLRDDGSPQGIVGLRDDIQAVAGAKQNLVYYNYNGGHYFTVGTVQGGLEIMLQNAPNPQIRAGISQSLELAGNNGAGGGGFVVPNVDNGYNLGFGSNRWTTVYAVTGTINTSSAAAKRDFAPLNAAACLQACKDVTWGTFEYLPPTPPEDAPDEAAAAQMEAAYTKMLTDTLSARRQRGYLIEDAPLLFGLEDRKSTTPQADLATVACALQEVIRRLEALEGAGLSGLSGVSA